MIDHARNASRCGSSRGMEEYEIRQCEFFFFFMVFIEIDENPMIISKNT